MKQSFFDTAQVEVSKRSHLSIGYIGQHTYGGIGLQIMKGIYDAARDYDVNLFCFLGGSTVNQSYGSNHELTAMKFAGPNSLDGIITWMSSKQEYMYTNVIDDLMNNYPDFPMVNISMTLPGHPSILLDNEQGIHLLIKHLIKKHQLQRIAFIKGNNHLQYFEERFQAYCTALKSYNIAYDPRLVIDTDIFDPSEEESDRTAREVVKILFEQRGLIPKQDIEAIITISDPLSVNIMYELQRRKINVPEDIAIVGFNNKPESYHCWPPLTTIEAEFYKDGYLAVETLVKKINKQPCPDKIMIPTKLIIRQSCGCFEKTIERVRAKESSPQMFNSSQLKQPNTHCNPQELISKITSDPYSKKLEYPLIMFIEEIVNYLQTGGDYNRIIRDFGNYVKLTAKEPSYLLHWQNAISMIRSEIQPYIKNYKQINNMENLWHQLRMVLFKKLEYSISTTEFSSINSPYDLAKVGSLLNNVENLDELTQLIVKILPRFKISGCYLALYENPQHPEDFAQMILAFNREQRFDLNKHPLIFKTSEILPQVLQDKEQHSFAVQSCFYKDYQLGYVIFEINSLEGTIYEALRANFSSALYGIFSIQERKKLVHTLELKNQELNQKNQAIVNVNEQLQIAIAETKKSNQAKTRFLANISHELRTPLNCIIGFAELIANTTSFQERDHYLNLIIAESENLIELISQLLDISKIEAGKLELTPAPFNIYQLIETLNSAYTTMASNKGLGYHAFIDKSIPEVIIGDPMRLRQILINLIGNAIKFTNEGSVTIDIKVAQITNETTTLKFSIKDTGIGIPKDKQTIIFEAFEQAETSTTRKFGGTGLGITISKELVQLMNGQIGVESEVNVGSTFWFTANFKIADKNLLATKSNPLTSPVISPQLSQTTILLVEDYPTNREVVKAHMKKIGCRLIYAENGKLAVTKFQENTFNLILMDVQMPEMNGYQATKIIRQLPGGASIPILGMTANAFESAARKCLEAGMNDVITKPFRRNGFIDKVVYWLNISLNRTDDSNKPEKTESLIKDTSPVIEGIRPLELSKTIAEFDGNRDLVINLINDFIANCWEQLATLETAASTEEFETIFRQAHSIKGGAANLNARDLATLAQKIETYGRQKNSNQADLSALIQEFRQQLQALEDYMKQQII